jgi:hypothetical protein
LATSVPISLTVPLRGRSSPEQVPEQRALARARAAHDHADLARADVEVDVVQHLALAEPGAQLVDLNEGRSGVHRFTK